MSGVTMCTSIRSASAGEATNVFEAALAHLRERESTPAFYHSLSSNCTTNLVDLLRTGRGDVLPGWHWSYWLPASFDRLLVERGLVEGATSVEPSGGGDVGNYPLSMEIPGSLAGRRGALSVGARRIRVAGTLTHRFEPRIGGEPS